MNTQKQEMLEKALIPDINYANTFPMWKIIKGYENYSVSELGDVKNNKTGRFLRLRRDTNGYLSIKLYKNGFYTRKLVHRLVAEAFIPNPMGYKVVNHINENKEDNVVYNLEWCTHQENIQYSKAINVIALRQSKPYKIYFNSIKELSFSGFDYNKVKESIENNTPYKGYFFQIKGTRAQQFKELSSWQ